jgi:G5-linked-Ubiquitin-like domain
MVVSGAWAKDVTLVIDGRSHAVRTRSTSVGDLLSDQGVPLSIGLQVQPPPATTLADGMTVYVSPPPGVPADGFSAAVTSTGVGVWVVERPGTGSFGKANPGRCRAFGRDRASRRDGEGARRLDQRGNDRGAPYGHGDPTRR